MTELYPFAEYWLFYLCFTLFIVVLLVADLGIFHSKAHEIKFKEATILSIVWISAGLIFSFVLYKFFIWSLPHDPRFIGIPHEEILKLAKRSSLEYLTGFIIEKSLSVDNLFVFFIVFMFFKIPPKYQHRILFFGILGALIFRAIFISLGALLVKYHLIVVLFGIILIITGVKILFGKEQELDPSKSRFMQFIQKHFPVTLELHEQSFFTRINHKLYITPLLIALINIEIFDIMFAIDSIPAIYAITKEPLIVFTSNVFAILGLRALYFVLSNVMYRFQYIKYGLALVLVFVGLKMAWLNQVFGGHFPIIWSLSIISTIIGTTIAISFFATRNKPNTHNH